MELVITSKYFKQTLYVVVAHGNGLGLDNTANSGSDSDGDRWGQYEAIDSGDEGVDQSSEGRPSASKAASSTQPAAEGAHSQSDPCPISTLGPVIGIITVANVPNHRQFVELENSASPVGEEELTLTNKRRKQLEQLRDKASEGQKVIAESALKDASMIASDLHTLAVISHLSTMGMARGSARQAMSMTDFESQVQMRALVLVSGEGPQLPAAYLLDAWYETALAHYNELIEVSTWEDKIMDDKQDEGALQTQTQGAYAALAGIPRLVQLVGETPWPMGVRQWKSNLQKITEGDFTSKINEIQLETAKHTQTADAHKR